MLVAPGPGGARLSALNEAALAAGLARGELLSNARSKVQGLQVADADPEGDAEALASLGLWCLRYTPLVMAWDEANGADGLYLEVQGSAHLFGGERALLDDLVARLQGFGLSPRLAIASTPGAAWAVARYGRTSPPITEPEIVARGEIVESGAEAAALRSLPLAALRLPAETLALARRLGLRRIADVLSAPRAPLSKRFGALFLLRLDQALGRAPEPLKALVVPASYHVRASFLEPISTQAHIVEAARKLLGDLAKELLRAGVGARRLMLLLFRPDGGVRSLELGLAAPSRDSAHMARLIELRLDRVAGGLEAEFGYEAMGLDVLLAEPMAETQAALESSGARHETADLAKLIDRIEQRLGTGSVAMLEPRQSHCPERAAIARPAGARLAGKGETRPAKEAAAVRWESRNLPAMARPLFLFPRPETAEVVALIPEGPPRQFRWRGMLHQVTGFEGPERIAPEWWRQDAAGMPERDYYAVEDTEGRRFWLFRAGRYGVDGITPRWFLHGVFA